jgi:membrane-associated phospholipid phosphatase
MNISVSSDQEKGTSIQLLDTKQIWTYSLLLGALFWIIGLILWWQGGIDRAILFYFDPQRVAYAPIIHLSKLLSAYGMAVITTLFILYLLFSKFFKSLDAPLTMYCYTICSYGLSGIAGDLLKEVFARPRPLAAFGSELMIISSSVTPALPSGHATKSIALILPFLVLVGNDKSLHKAIKVIIALIGVGVCFSRIALGAHYLSDVLAGIGMALVGLPLTMLFSNMLLRKMKKEKLPALSIVWGFLLVFLVLVFMAL